MPVFRGDESVMLAAAMDKMEREAAAASPGSSATLPPKSLLLYLVRMGSFTSTPKMQNGDTQDRELEVPKDNTTPQLLEFCRDQLAHRPPLLERALLRLTPPPPSHPHHQQENGDSGGGGGGGGGNSGNRIRVMQWNILSQALGQQNDNFVACPDDALDWSTRRFRILEEMLTYQPDVLCLQEVDHFHFLNKTLGSVGYAGTFFPKPDSPCIYIEGNNGPDGCAIFYNAAKFKLVKSETRVMEVWNIQSNQVIILNVLRVLATGQHICVVTTHLKARQGALLSTLRNEQGKDLIEFITAHYGGSPLIVAGDFNAEPTEPVYATVLGNKQLALTSCYTAASNRKEEPPYTTWKIREDGEVCHTIDYIFHSQAHFDVDAVLQFPTGEEMGAGRVPSLQYPSDHFSLVCDFRLKSAKL